MREGKFQDHSVEIKMSLRKLQKIYKFPKQQLQDIRKQFNRHADKDGEICFEGFKRFMGLLGFGEAQVTCERLFQVIVPQGEQKFNFIDLVKFLSTMIYGGSKEKAKLSFKFIDKNKRDKIGYEQVSAILCQISILWNYLTGEKALPTTETIEILCEKLGIMEGQELVFEEYLHVFEEQTFDWFDFFNDQLKPSKANTKNKSPSLEEMEALLDLFSHEIFDIIMELNECSDPAWTFSVEDVDFQSISPIKGPLHIESRFAPLRGDAQQNVPQLPSFQNILGQIKEKQACDKTSTYLAKISEKLNALAQMGLKSWTPEAAHRESLTERASTAVQMDKATQRKATIMNKGMAAKTHPGGTIYFGHQNWNLIVSMMLGIRKSVRVLYMPQEMEHRLTTRHLEEEFQGKYSYQLINKKDDKFEKDYSFTFVDYCPKVFYRIRNDEGLTNQIYLRSIGPQNLIGSLVMGKLSTLNEQISSGKSGSFFYYTEDSRFIVKTISQDQLHQIKNNLKRYRSHIVDNPDTLITKIFGLHKLKQTHGPKRYYFVVMANVFRFPLEIDFRYDLKGYEDRKGRNNHWSKNVALKDMDFIEDNRLVEVTQPQKQKILGQVKQDIHFFTMSNIMDYSLLVGIHKCRGPYDESDIKQRTEKFRGIFSKDKKCVYFLGFIDYFTQYKGMKLLTPSSLSPLAYEARFLEFLSTNVFKQTP